MAYLDDPRVFFAAEGTLLAWNRTSLTLMGFGFVVERFGLFAKLLLPAGHPAGNHDLAFWVGVGFILLGTAVSLVSVVQFRRVLRQLGPAEIPAGYFLHAGVVTNLALCVLGVALLFYLFHGLG